MPLLSFKMSASCQDWPEIFHQTHVSVTTFSCTRIRLCLDAIFTINSFPESSPPSESHVCQSAPLDQLAKFEKASEGCRETGEGGKSFLGVEAEPVRRADSLFLFVWSFFRLSAPSLSLFAGRMGGDEDERGISLTKSVSTTKRRLYQIPLIPTQQCQTNHSPALWKKGLICRRHTSFFLFFQRTEHTHTFHIFLPHISDGFEILLLNLDRGPFARTRLRVRVLPARNRASLQSGGMQILTKITLT